jgi:hypothetical protein
MRPEKSRLDVLQHLLHGQQRVDFHVARGQTEHATLVTRI